MLFDDGPMVATIFVLIAMVPDCSDLFFFINKIPVLTTPFQRLLDKASVAVKK